MATELLMPKLGLTMTEGTIDEWKKKEGDAVQKGEIIYSVATDKLTNDVESDADGVLLKILVAEGETVPCKTLVGWIGAPGEAVPDGAAPVAPAAEAPAAAAPASGSVAAAVSAARAGMRTVLVERLGVLGGTAAVGYVNPISGFFQQGQRVVGGIAWEFVQRLHALGAAQIEYPKGHVSFHPEAWKLAAQRMALESGVELMTNMTLSDCVREGSRVTHVILDGKSGPEAVAARCFIDATGDADLCRLAGAEMLPEEAEGYQPASLCFVLEGVDVTTPLLKNSIHHTGAGGSHSSNDAIHAYLDACVERGELEQFGGPWFNAMVQGGAVTVNVTRRAGNGADRRDLTRMECQLREDMFRIVALLKREYPEFRSCSIAASGINAGIRETARIRGLDTVTGEDIGRCVSADARAYATLRVQATVMAIGESAGLMAAELCDHGEIDPQRLRTAIQKRGVIPAGM